MNQNELSVLKEDSICQLYAVVINTIFFLFKNTKHFNTHMGRRGKV